MSKSQVLTLATIAIALVGAATAAVAVEATQDVAPRGTLTRAEVQADLHAARVAATQAPMQAAPRVIQLGEATVFVDAPGTRTREAVRDEARAAARSSRGDNNYGG
jgi:hypothetical protein